MGKGLIEILQSPDWLPLRLNASGDVTFVRLSDAEQRLATFLNDRYVAPEAPRTTFPLAAIHGVGPLPLIRPLFLFHSSFCGSTLLVHAFGATSRVIGYSEPQILNDFAALANRGAFDRRLLKSVIALLCIQRGGIDHCVIKPTNELNFLLGPLMNVFPEARAVFLSSPLDDFLYSIARKGLRGRVWVRRQNQALRRAAGLTFGFNDQESLEHSDLQVAALFWLQNRALFRAVADADASRCASLMNTDISSDLQSAVLRAAQFFAIDLSEADLHEAAMQGRRNVKNGALDFDPMERGREREELKTFVAEDIDLVSQWAMQIVNHVGMSTALPPAV